MPMLWPLRSLRTKREGVGEHERKEDDAGAELVAATAGDDEAADGAMTGCAAVTDDNDVDDAEGDEVTGCATVAGDFDFALAVAEEEGGGTIIGFKTVLEEVEACGRTMLLVVFLAAA
jgi:hypothetical protein